MKTIQNITIAEIQQKLEVIEIQLKLLFKSYEDFINNFLMWRIDDPKKQNLNAKQKLISDFKLIMRTLEEYSQEISRNVDMVDALTDKARATKSVSMIKSMEHNLYKVDKILLRCNTYIFLIDESQVTIAETLDYDKENKKRILN
jgi:uncharacterized protein YsxB (DUF464 family)